MQVRIDGKTVKLTNRQIIGVGGEATIFAHNGSAVKIYQQPNAERAQKLRVQAARTAGLPPEVIAPQKLVCDAAGKTIVGFTMRLLTADYAEVRRLSNKQYRAQTQIDAREVAALFLNTHRTLSALHRAGIVVGDFNDLNLMFRGGEMIFIDVDSFQFDAYPCMVGTEAFLAPELYGVNLAAQPIFQPEHDWYSFAVLLFKSLLLTHPYGGVHPTARLLTQRAQQRISVFDPTVTYPRIAYRPELLSDDLAEVFSAWFDRGQRGVFPEQALHAYAADLKVCPACQAAYPSNRARCPLCSASVPVVLPAAMLAGCRTFISTAGQIIAWHSDGTGISALAHEDGKVTLYRWNSRETSRQILFNAMPAAAYAFMGDYLVISPTPTSPDLMIVDISGGAPTAVCKTTTQSFGGGKPMFGANGRALYRLAGGYLMRGQFQNGQFFERAVMAAAEEQTWFQTAPHADQLFGFFRVFDGTNVDYKYWLLLGDEHIDIPLTALSPGELLLDTAAYFSASSVLVLRQTQLAGVEQIRLDEINHHGALLYSTVKTDVETYLPLASHGYTRGILLRASDSGVVQEHVDSGTKKIFTQTEPFTRQGDALHPYQGGLLALHHDRIIHLTA